MTTLHRTFVAPDIECRAEATGKYVQGIAVPFNVEQRIDGSLVEGFRSGAVDHQMAAANRVWLAREHIMLGGELIGSGREMRNDAAGLFVRMKVADTDAGRDTYALMDNGALRELSVGFNPVSDQRGANGTVWRTRVNLKEVAVVLQGAYGENATAMARSRGIDVTDPEVAALLAQYATRAEVEETAVLATPGLAELDAILARTKLTA